MVRARDQILAFLQANPETEYTQGDIISAIKRPQSSTSRGIQELVNMGLALTRYETVGTITHQLIRLAPEGTAPPKAEPPPAPSPPLTKVPTELKAPVTRMEAELDVKRLHEHLDLIEGLCVAVTKDLTGIKRSLEPAELSQADKINSIMLRHVIQDLSGVDTRFLRIPEMKEVIRKLLDNPLFDVKAYEQKRKATSDKDRPPKLKSGPKKEPGPQWIDGEVV